MIQNCFEIQRARKATREARKLSVRTIEAETGIARNALNALAANSTTRISFEVLDTLCKYFDCTVGELLEFLPDGGK